MSLTAKVLERLPSLYGWAKKGGLFESAAFRRLFVGTYFFYKRHFEDPFFGLCRERPELFRGGHILDVGANIGYTAAVFRWALSPGFKVWAFEPEEANFAFLEDSVSARHAEGRIVPVRAAVGAREGTVDLWHNDAHHGDHRVLTSELRAAKGSAARVASVPLHAVDSFTASRDIQGAIRFIKIDVQGYELEVCKGMSETLEKNPEVSVAIEYAPDGMRELGFEPRELMVFFRDRGFRLDVIERDGRLTPAPFDSIDGMTAEKGYFDLLCRRGS